jgi:ATP-binding cassette subfamily F protein uup
VKALSGGERNRLLLARLFLEGANVLVLDEPTNDLDIVTLNILERLLLDFGGSTLLVTHDRYFLDKVATSILTFEGGGRVTRYEGNYAMYRRLKEQSEAQAATAAAKPAPKKEEAPAASKAARKPGKLSYKDQRELDGMEATIEAAETKKAGLEAQLADPAVYSNGAKVAEVNKELEATAAEVDRLYARWQELQDLAAGGA